ncbi:MAG: hypothetical protein ACKOET_07280 [Verrucomicrobiota bacterium]
MLEWNIQSRGHVCHHTGRPFADGETYHTVLREAKGGFERLDFSAGAWKEKGPEVLGQPHCVSHWMGTYEAPPAAPPDPIRKDDAESLLRKLLELRRDAYAGAAFILAVMLERKRELRMKAQVREEGRRRIVYEHPKSGDVLVVADPGLQLDQLEAVQRQVAELLEQGLPAEPLAEAGPVEEPFNPPSEVPILAAG